ncbi:MAG: hypothetical protein GX230_02190, partial [Lentisphaerae bacterium]|nr:hypothetical protein [Lentisphaerota bacterium]
MFRRHNCIISQINTVLTPNNLPVTNFPIAVVDVAVKQVCFSGEDGYLASWLCGTENLSGKLGSLHVSVTPAWRSVTVVVNGREYEATDDTLIPLLEADVGASFAVILGSGSNRHIYNEATGNVGLYGHCSSHNTYCCSWCDGCGLDAGDFDSGGGSAWFAMGLGRSNPKTAAGVIHFRRDAGPLTANSSLLRTLVPSTTAVERDAGGDLRSIRTASHLFAIHSVAEGLLITTTNLSERRLEARCLLTNPDGDTNRLEISGGRLDGQQHTFAFAWNPDNTTWTFQNGASDDPNRAVESIRTVTNSTGNIVEERRIFDANNTLLRRTTTEYQLYDDTRLPLRQTTHAAAEGDDVWSDITESMEYYDDPDEAGSYRRLARRQHSDGSWEWLAYDPLGRTALHASPWLDGAAPPSYASDPFSFPSARVITNSYISLDPTLDDLTIRPTTPRTTAEYIITANGTPRLMSRQWHLFTTTNWYGEIVISEISERAATATALFGDPNNQRTVTISYPEAVGDWRSGRTLSILRPDGTLTTTWHEAGEAEADGIDFEPGGTASHRRAITVSGTAHHPYGLPQRTLIHTEVSDMRWDRLLLSETHVVASPAHPTATDEHALIDWTLHTYDNNGRRLTSHYADGTVESNLWDCCHLTATIGRDGTERRFGYDSMGRRFRDEESSIASLPGSNGHRPASDTAYDPLGRVTKTTLRVRRPDGTAAPGYTPLVTRTIYQNLTEGDIVTIDEKGRETVSSSDSWGDSRWGDGIPYSLSRSYADGSPAHEESFWSSNIATDTPWDQGEISHWQSWDESVSADGVLV